VNVPNKKDQLPIELVIRRNKINVLKCMLKRDDIKLGQLKNGYSPLVDACEKDLTELGLLLIDAGADLNARDNNDRDGQMWTPLMHSVSNNNEILTTKLVEKGADLDAVDLNGNSVVHMAVINDNEFILGLLLKRNAQRNLLNNDNLSPLDLAKLNESEECIKLLS